jgi:hypothetical protein
MEVLDEKVRMKSKDHNEGLRMKRKDGRKYGYRAPK